MTWGFQVCCSDCVEPEDILDKIMQSPKICSCLRIVYLPHWAVGWLDVWIKLANVEGIYCCDFALGFKKT